MLSTVSDTIIDTSHREDVRSAFVERYQPALKVQPHWTGNTATCVAGTMNAEFTNATLQMINYFRGLTGLPGVTLDPTLNDKAMQAALIMDAQNSLSHAPPSDWKCYSAEGANAAGHSNLYLGVTGPAAIAGYIEDPGSANTAVGHRRWILFPPQDTMGSGSTTRANALWVIGTAGARPSGPSWISWPPQGYVPYQHVYPRWSLSKNDISSGSVDFSQATMQMTANGQAIPVQVKPVSNGYGDNTLVWEPQLPAFSSGFADLTYQVTVGNIIVAGTVEQFSYQVRVFDPAINVPGETLPLADDFESNDSFALATDAGASDQSIGGLTIHVPGDRDFYRWRPSSGGIVSVGLSSAAYGEQMRLSLYDDSQNLLKSVEGSDGPLFLSVDATAGKSLYLLVEGDGQNLNADYSLTLGHTVPPDALDDRAATERNQPVLVNVLANDHSENGTIAPGSVRIVSQPVHGTLRVDPQTGTVNYSPEQGFLGFDQASYVVADNRGMESTPATIRFTVLDVAAHPWQNPGTPQDVNCDGVVTPADALAVINHLNSVGSSRLSIDIAAGLFPPMYLDPSGDDYAAPADALLIINYLNRISSGEGEGLIESTRSAPVLQPADSGCATSSVPESARYIANDLLLANQRTWFAKPARLRIDWGESWWPI